MEVPKLKSDNFDDFELTFTAAVRRQKSMHGSVYLDYLVVVLGRDLRTWRVGRII